MKYTFLLSLLISTSFNAPAKENGKIDSLIQIINEIRYDQPDSSLKLIRLAYQLHPSKDSRYAALLFSEAAIRYIRGDYVTSQNKYIELYQLYDSLNDQKGLAKALNGRGLIYLGRELYPEAISMFRKAATTNLKSGNESGLPTNYLNIGICYSKLDKHEEALSYFHQSLNLAEKSNNSLIHLMGLNQLGKVHLLKQNYDSASFYFSKVLSDSSKANQWEKSFALLGQSEIAYGRKDYDLSIKKGLEAFEIAHELNVKWDLARIAETLSKAYEANNQLKAALKFHKQYKSYNDSLLNEAKNREINWAELQQSRAENDKLSNEKALLDARASMSQLIIIILSVIILLLALITFLFRKNAQQKVKYNHHLNLLNQQTVHQKIQIEEQNTALNELNNSKNRLFSILAHDLKSPLLSIQQLLDLNQKSKLSETNMNELLIMLSKQVHNVNKMLNDLLSWANSQMDGMTTRPETLNLTDLTKEVLHSVEYVAEEKQIKIEHQESDIIKIYADVGHIKIILLNLLNNALKFTNKNGVIKVHYSESEKEATIYIQDNGIGMESSTIDILMGIDNKTTYSRTGTSEEMGTGLGLLLVKQFAHYNNAQFHIKSKEGEGSTFSISFPKALHQQTIQ
ncbi:tetratricopeptide repeat-containing sensor histidine kinase [Marivirga sp. S37H4]|uniref:histidine kinase n=1 Tax=Marivirga aurantiaca TaxID=2802615 RepID=A0A934X0F2_9BACT|nr:tetratricopeptide repeat-containing sensor histidine kinase [Marivirga aurantiaca]MBK6266374.1 tetratricopeptide repeat-containing sensor histidine kinase [Marivirga aurantiaca]